VWDKTFYNKFNIDYYLQAWTHYRERFELLVEIMYHEDTKLFFPTYIKWNGLLDYVFNGTPDVQFSKQIREYIDSVKWDRMKDFSAIQDTYFRALQKLRDHNKLVEDTVSIFKPDKKSVFTPPMDLEFKKGGTSNFKRVGRVATREGKLTCFQKRTSPLTVVSRSKQSTRVRNRLESRRAPRLLNMHRLATSLELSLRVTRILRATEDSGAPPLLA